VTVIIKCNWLNLTYVFFVLNVDTRREDGSFERKSEFTLAAKEPQVNTSQVDVDAGRQDRRHIQDIDIDVVKEDKEKLKMFESSGYLRGLSKVLRQF